MITVVCVRHVEDLNEKLRQVIVERMPSTVCVELDELGYNTLLGKTSKEEERYYFRKKMKENIYLRRGLRIETSLAAYQITSAKKTRYFNIGEEFKTAIRVATEIGAKIFPIDMDRSAVAELIGKRMSLKERINLFLGCLRGSLLDRAGVEKKRKECEKEGYEEIFARNYPVLKQILIDERNLYMAEKIRGIYKENSNMAVIIGNAHVEGICKALMDFDLRIIKLDNLRNICHY